MTRDDLTIGALVFVIVFQSSMWWSADGKPPTKLSVSYECVKE